MEIACLHSHSLCAVEGEGLASSRALKKSTYTIMITFRVKLMSFSGYAMLEGISGYGGGILWLCKCWRDYEVFG